MRRSVLLAVALSACSAAGPSQRHAIDEAHNEAVIIRQRLEQRAMRGEQCSTDPQAVAAIDPGFVADPWGNPYNVACEPEIVVISRGPDGASGTADDISSG